MPQVPDDLTPLSAVIKQHKPSRSWWDKQIAEGRLQAYKVPGERGLYVSESEVRAFMLPRPHERGSDGEEEVG